MEEKPESLASIKRDAKRSLKLLAGIVASFWLVAIANVSFFSGSLLRFGVTPRTTFGLIGVLAHPFLHLGVAHLFLNSIGFLLLGGLVILREQRDFWIATILGTVLGGMGVWLMGRSTVHVGASGVIFAYFGYLVTTGWYDRRFGAILLSVLVILIWGSMVFGLFPTQAGVSWEMHLFGFLTGVLTAWLRTRARANRGGLTSA